MAVCVKVVSSDRSAMEEANGVRKAGTKPGIT
jgi:hypothetical protein